jgi:hypothetical protein
MIILYPLFNPIKSLRIAMFDTTRSVSVAATLLGLLTPITRAGAVTSDELLPSYDYIVVGGGTSGLTVANRLSEDRSK